MGWIARLALELDFDPGAATQDPLSVDSYFFSKSTEINFCGRHATTSAPPTSRHLRQFCPTAFLASDPASCTRDYGENCPEGWMDATGRGNCFPPVSYQGPCKTISVGNNADVTTKEMHSHRCRVKWPCVPQKAAKIDAKGQPMVTRPEDFARICPSGWILAKRGAPDRPQYVCKAPENYTGNCYYEQNMEGLTPSERKTWGRLCEAAVARGAAAHDLSRRPGLEPPVPARVGLAAEGRHVRGAAGVAVLRGECAVVPGSDSRFQGRGHQAEIHRAVPAGGVELPEAGGLSRGVVPLGRAVPTGVAGLQRLLPAAEGRQSAGRGEQGVSTPVVQAGHRESAKNDRGLREGKGSASENPNVVTDKAKWVWSQLCGAEWSCNNPEDNELALGSMDNVNLVDL
eukprot:CAMPEP_0178996290 /NCGR_PEP_ID=MMETSP0795-20121207/8293_1 /TAXON_ID=88552 /ORGANISM="Amoebophrya sp., Strain Ameob2" /LENGTH=399 /DNA_ID=CAMNT_0020688677 /DNA_START=89 /DNA_END=1288 /DNA_ORIENTATION=+